MTIRPLIQFAFVFSLLLSNAFAEKFPFADGTFDNNGNLQPWNLQKVHSHRDETIGNLENKNAAEKDAAANPAMLGYHSERVESENPKVPDNPGPKLFETNIDLTNIGGLVYVAIHVDDIANLTVTEIDDAGKEIGTPNPFNIDGSALWRAEKSYKEFPNPIAAGRKYKLKLVYQNTVNLTNKSNGLIDYDGVTVFLIHLPVEVIELSPKLLSEDGKIIPNSEKPAVAPEPSEMVERDPLASPEPLNDASAIGVAWRDMRVKIGKSWAGKKITWFMAPLFIPSVVNSGESSEILTPDPAGAKFRGSWSYAVEKTYRDAFSSSLVYEKHEWVRGDATSDSVPGTAITTVDPEGYTAIRVNLPPVGFNKAKIKIKIEGIETEIDLIDFVVPAVVVIDPGHGGALADGIKGGSSPNNAFSYGSAPAPSDSETPGKVVKLWLIIEPDWTQ